MIEILRRNIEKVIIEPIKKNTILVLAIIGIILILSGAIVGSYLKEHWTAEALVKFGVAILGAGVFAFILKSAQFTEIFQKYIYDVFYSPSDTFGIDVLKEKWLLLTQAILKGTLPFARKEAAQRIEKQFLGAELDYHYEDMEVTYDITVNYDRRIAATIHTVKTRIVVSDQSNPILEQEMNVGGNCELVTLIINEKDIKDSKDYLFFSDENVSEERKFKLPLKNFTQGLSEADDKTVRFERVYRMTQDLYEEPYWIATFKRYVRGLTVKARIPADYRLYFKITGFQYEESYPSPIRDDRMFERWTLATKDRLLLPGQGYILIAIPTKDQE